MGAKRGTEREAFSLRFCRGHCSGVWGLGRCVHGWGIEIRFGLSSGPEVCSFNSVVHLGSARTWTTSWIGHGRSSGHLEQHPQQNTRHLVQSISKEPSNMRWADPPPPPPTTAAATTTTTTPAPAAAAAAAATPATPTSATATLLLLLVLLLRYCYYCCCSDCCSITNTITATATSST